MSPLLTHTERKIKSFPRVSGDEPDLIGVAADLAAFSPRERG